jgi:hypothetical protein
MELVPIADSDRDCDDDDEIENEWAEENPSGIIGIRHPYFQLIFISV